MRTIVILLIIFFNGCHSKKETVKATNPEDTIKIVPQAAPAAIKENSMLVGAVIDSVYLIDILNYKLVVTLQTAIPDQFNEGLAEPGQVIEVQPNYIKNENNVADLNHPTNQKLYDLRNIKKGGFFIGKITLTKDFKWYITDIELYQNLPEGKKNEF